MKQTFTARIFQEGTWFVAQCLEVDVASQGETETEALNNLQEALELHFETPHATIVPSFVPRYKEVTIGTISSILRQADLRVDEFDDL